MITIKNIATHFSVSAAAVSKALNGQPGVSDSLRSEIARYAKQHNYVPNIYGKGLKGKASKVLGVIITDNTNPSYSSTLKVIEAEADRYGYCIILSNSNDEWRREYKALEMMVQKGVNGVLVVPSQISDEEDDPAGRYAILERSNVPYVLLNRVVEGCACDSVSSDNIRAGEMAGEYLVAKGHRHIIHVTTGKNISSAIDRSEGFQRALDKHGIPREERNIIRIDDYSREACTEAMRGILAQRRDFTAVLAFNDNMAFGLMKALLAEGLKIPDDVAVMGYDDNGFADISLVPLTTVPQENAYLGATALAMIVERVKGARKTPLQKMIVPSRIVERSSV